MSLAQTSERDYCNNAMKMLALKLTRIGNSKGVRLPTTLIKRYGFSGFLAVAARKDGLAHLQAQSRAFGTTQGRG